MHEQVMITMLQFLAGQQQLYNISYLRDVKMCMEGMWKRESGSVSQNKLKPEEPMKIKWQDTLNT